MALLLPTSDIAFSLPADAYHAMLDGLRQTLPPPPDDPQDRKRRDHAIITQLSAFRPIDAAEGLFAAQVVGTNQQWLDALRLVQIHLAAGNQAEASRCRAHAAASLRGSHAAQRTLLATQAARQRLHANPEATERAERVEHITTHMLIAALAEIDAKPDKPPAPIPAPIPGPAPGGDPGVKAGEEPYPTPSPVSYSETKSRTKKTETPARQSEPPSREPPKGSPARRALIEAFLYGKRPYDPRRPSPFYPFKRGCNGLPPSSPWPPQQPPALDAPIEE